VNARTLTLRRIAIGLVVGLLTAVAGAAVGAAGDNLPAVLRTPQVLVVVAVAAVVIAVTLQVLLDSDGRAARGLCRVAAVSHGEGTADVIAVTTTGSVVTATYTENLGWSAWVDLGAEGKTVDVAALIRVGDEVEFFAVDSDGVLRTMRRGDHGSTSWQPIGGNVLGGRLRRIAAVSHTDNHREVFGVTNTGRGLNMWSGGVGDWSDWHDMWSPPARDVGVCSNKSRLMECFVATHDGDVWHRWFWETQWVDWYTWGRERGAVVAVAGLRNSDATQEMLAVDSTGRLAHRWYNVQESWSVWTHMEAPKPMIDVAGAATSGGKPNFFTVDRDGRLWQRSYADGDWGPWRTVPVGKPIGQRRQEVH
jgi:hypothetical protein